MALEIGPVLLEKGGKINEPEKTDNRKGPASPINAAPLPSGSYVSLVPPGPAFLWLLRFRPETRGLRVAERFLLSSPATCVQNAKNMSFARIPLFAERGHWEKGACFKQ